MKEIITMLCLAAWVPVSHGQKGLSLGANFMPMSTNIVVQNTWGNGHEYEYEAVFNTSYGLDIGYNFSGQFGVYTGYWFTDLGQNYKDTYNGSDWERSLKFKYNMIPVMLKFNGTKSKVNFLGGVGILFASLQEAEQEWLRDGMPYSQVIENPVTGEDFNLGETDVTHRYNESDIILDAEIGARMRFGDKMFLDAVLNFGYGLKDINHEDWHIPDSDGTYEPSHNAFVGLRLGLAYMLFTD